MIEVNNLVKKFGKHEVLNNISFKIKRGEIYGFLGPNGAGKTTTIRILTSYFPPTSGSVSVAGFDIQKDSDKARSKIGYLPESVPLYQDMNVLNYLIFMTKLKGMKSKKAKELVYKIIKSCQLDEVKEKMIMNLSKGYKQRVGLAQALVHEPEVLILDEPTIGLDPNQIKKTRELIKENAGSRTVLISTHILPEVSQICDHVLIIDKGRIIASDKPENLVRKIKSAEGLYLKIRAKEEELSSSLKSVKDISNISIKPLGDGSFDIELESILGSDVREKLSNLIVNKGWGLLEMRPITLDLEDVFHRLTMEETS
jgi:ABC-2 type transport system ATP-binding protein